MSAGCSFCLLVLRAPRRPLRSSWSCGTPTGVRLARRDASGKSWRGGTDGLALVLVRVVARGVALVTQVAEVELVELVALAALRGRNSYLWCERAEGTHMPRR